MKRLDGTILLEVIVVAALVTTGLLLVSQTFTVGQASQSRTDLKAIALTDLTSQIDLDSTLPYNQVLTATVSVANLPQATLSRTVSEDTVLAVKYVHYRLSWLGPGGTQMVTADSFQVAQGLNNE